MGMLTGYVGDSEAAIADVALISSQAMGLQKQLKRAREREFAGYVQIACCFLEAEQAPRPAPAKGIRGAPRTPTSKRIMADGGNLSGRASQGSLRTGGDATAGEGVEADGHGGSLLVDKYTVHALEEQLRSGPTRSREMTCSALWGLSTFAPNRRSLADLFPRLVTYIADASLLQVREKAAGALANLAEDEEVLVAPPAAIWRQSGARRALSVARGQVCARYARDVNLTGLRRMLVVLRYGLPHLDGDDEDGSAGEHGTRLHFGPEQASRLGTRQHPSAAEVHG